MKAVVRTAFLVSFLLCVAPVQATWIEPFISEIHYDNVGSDADEFVAVTVPGGWDLSGWQLALYNGANGEVYHTETLAGSVPAGAALGEFWWLISGMQNADEAVALVSATGQLIDFVAYEGIISAVEGAAVGVTPRLLPISESSATLVGWSLQRRDTANEWEWVAAEANPGLVNPGLRTTAGGNGVMAPVPLWLWFAAAPALALHSWRQNRGVAVEKGVPPTGSVGG